MAGSGTGPWRSAVLSERPVGDSGRPNRRDPFRRHGRRPIDARRDRRAGSAATWAWQDVPQYVRGIANRDAPGEMDPSSLGVLSGLIKSSRSLKPDRRRRTVDARARLGVRTWALPSRFTLRFVVHSAADVFAQRRRSLVMPGVAAGDRVDGAHDFGELVEHPEHPLLVELDYVGRD